jgi:zinc/manganese transport system substrate-binding protein
MSRAKREDTWLGRVLVMMLLALMLLAMMMPAATLAGVRVVTTNPTLADLTRQVGGEHVRVESLMRGPENPHNVIPKPSFVMKLRKADLFVHLGLDAEPWVPNLLRSARQERLLAGGRGNVDASAGVALLEVPSQGELTRALGDIHVYGNTHYVLDPLNGVLIGRTIAKALARVDPDNASMFEERALELERGLGALTEKLTLAMAPLAGSQVVVYHRTWPYFLKRFKLTKLDEVEPKPGIAPGPRHIAQLAEEMLQSRVGFVIVESFSNQRTAERLADLAKGQIVLLAQEVDAVPGVDTYQALFEYNIAALLKAHRALAGTAARLPAAETRP